MRRFGRRGKRRSLVRWLPDHSAFSELKGLVITGPTAFNYGSIDLLAQRGGVPDALLAGTLTSPSRTQIDNLILDHLKGKVWWGIEGNDGVEASQDASGSWLFVIRAAIAITERDPEAGGGAAFTPDLGPGGLGRESGQALDPGSNVPVLNMGSYTPDGFRILWRRTWATHVQWAAPMDPRPMAPDNEFMCPPGPYLDVKPKRLLRSSEVLLLQLQVQALPGVNASGTARLWFGHDVRVAAHNTQRRR